jgi:hypothetical protein
LDHQGQPGNFFIFSRVKKSLWLGHYTFNNLGENIAKIVVVVVSQPTDYFFKLLIGELSLESDEVEVLIAKVYDCGAANSVDTHRYLSLLGLGLSARLPYTMNYTRIFWATKANPGIFLFLFFWADNTKPSTENSSRWFCRGSGQKKSPGRRPGELLPLWHD